MKVECPSCQTDLYLEDMIRYIICNKCEIVKCPNCDEWISRGEEGLSYHYYIDECMLVE